MRRFSMLLVLVSLMTLSVSQRPFALADQIQNPAHWQTLQNLLPPEEQAMLQASNAEKLDQFGTATAISGNTLIVSAPYEAGGNNTLPNSGAVYVFVHDPQTNTWSEQAILRASNPEDGAMFGYDLDIDGDTIVVGSPTHDGPNGDSDNRGAAYVFVRDPQTNTWSEQAILYASNGEYGDWFGASVDIDADTVAIGALYENTTVHNGGAVYVFVRSSHTWNEQSILYHSIASSADAFGSSVALDGDTIVAGTHWRGRAFVFVRENNTWNEQANFQAPGDQGSEGFGQSLAILGNTIAVGAPLRNNVGAVYIFNRENTTWNQQALLYPSTFIHGMGFGISIAMDKNVLIVGAVGKPSSANNTFQAGATYVFVRAGNHWIESAVIESPSDTAYARFGSSVAVLGDTLVSTTVSDYFSEIEQGAAYVFSLIPQAPTVNIGYDQRAAANAPVTLSGTATYLYPEQLRYAWSYTGTHPVTLSHPFSPTTSFIAPNAADVLTFTLTVSTTDGMTATDDVVVTVLDQAPVATAGFDQSVSSRHVVTLAGYGSDPDLEGLSYEWNQTGGVSVTLSTPFSPTTTFFAPDVSDVLTFTLTVTNSQQSVDMDTVEVTVTAPVSRSFLPRLYRICRMSEGC